MAVERPITNAPVVEEERTWRANIETPRGGNYSIQIFREVVQKDSEGNVVAVRQLTAPVHRMAAAIQTESVMVGGNVVPATLILAALPLFFDRWAEEDAGGS